MKALGALAVLFFGPPLGLAIGLFFAALALPADPNFIADAGHAAPGDGFLIVI